MRTHSKSPAILMASITLVILLNSCRQDIQSIHSLLPLINGTPSITGNPEYIKSPYTTAGNRLYMIGFQDGTFPEMGFHTPGEMGGIWDHPIKLMDGFDVELTEKSTANSVHLDKADTFINYPFANKHIYHIKAPDIDVTRFQFVPDSLQGIIIEFDIKNIGATTLDLSFRLKGSVDLSPAWLAERINIKNGKDILSRDEKNNAIVGKDSLNDWYVAFCSGLSQEIVLDKKDPSKRFPRNQFLSFAGRNKNYSLYTLPGHINQKTT
ncbi:MAG: hypothetical protein WDN75_19975 [Bacteroidota bacterium]